MSQVRRSVCFKVGTGFATGSSDGRQGDTKSCAGGADEGTGTMGSKGGTCATAGYLCQLFHLDNRLKKRRLPCVRIDDIVIKMFGIKAWNLTRETEPFTML